MGLALAVMIVGFGALFSNETCNAGQENPTEKNLFTHMHPLQHGDDR